MLFQEGTQGQWRAGIVTGLMLPITTRSKLWCLCSQDPAFPLWLCVMH